MLAEVAELEIHHSASKAQLARLKQSHEEELEAVSQGFQRKLKSMQEVCQFKNMLRTRQFRFATVGLVHDAVPHCFYVAPGINQG